jgi:hypothetical protein
LRSQKIFCKLLGILSSNKHIFNERNTKVMSNSFAKKRNLIVPPFYVAFFDEVEQE